MKKIIFLMILILSLLLNGDIIKNNNYIISYNKMKNIIFDIFLIKTKNKLFNNKININNFIINKYNINESKLYFSYKYYFIYTDLYLNFKN